MAQTQLDTLQPRFTTVRESVLAPAANDNWMFSLVNDVAIDRLGQTYVLDPIESTVHVFSTTGKHLRALGRNGAGPGEFSRAGRLQILGDTVFIEDRGNGRFVSWSTVTGKLLASRRGLPQYSVGLSPVGMYVRRGADENDNSGGPRNRPSPYEISHKASDSKVPVTIAKLTYEHGWLRYPSSRSRPVSRKGGGMSREQPFDDSPQFRISPDGRAVLIAERSSSEIVFNRNPFANSRPQTTVRVRQITVEGKASGHAEFRAAVRPLSAADVKSVVDSFAAPLTAAPGVVFYANAADISDSLYVPQTWPAFTEMFAGDDGVVWLRQPRTASRFAAFWRVKLDGTALPSVEVPAGLQILRVSADRIWAVVEAADGSPTVEIHRVAQRPDR
ncbi:MAG: 6-bladed beta-propeller [Gemmatimonas sp.]